MRGILKEVLKEIKPSKEEEKDVAAKIDRVIKKIKRVVPEYKVVLGGSGQKGTWLKQVHDADIFVKFPSKYREMSEELSEILGKKLKKIFRITRLHGSRDYFQTKLEDFTFEIIPIIDIKKAQDALNITDVSPLHAEWVKKHSKYADDIRLIKQFFKAAKVYGAESYIRGFSGYICEILTIYYKGFENLIKAIAKWKAKVIIDMEGYYKGRKEVLFNIDKAKTQGPLIIIDPVQASRNAGAAVSKEKFDMIIEYSKKFLENPDRSCFEMKSIDIGKLKNKANKDELFVFEVIPLRGKEDVIGCKLFKAFNHIKKKVKKNEFRLLFSDWEWNRKAGFYYIIKNEKLSDKKIVRGPPKRIKYYSCQFKKKHKEVYEDSKYLFAKERREFLKPYDLMKAMKRDKYIKEKVKKIDLRAE